MMSVRVNAIWLLYRRFPDWKPVLHDGSMMLAQMAQNHGVVIWESGDIPSQTMLAATLVEQVDGVWRHEASAWTLHILAQSVIKTALSTFASLRKRLIGWLQMSFQGRIVHIASSFGQTLCRLLQFMLLHTLETIQVAAAEHSMPVTPTGQKQPVPPVPFVCQYTCGGYQPNRFWRFRS